MPLYDNWENKPLAWNRRAGGVIPGGWEETEATASVGAGHRRLVAGERCLLWRHAMSSHRSRAIFPFSETRACKMGRKTL